MLRDKINVASDSRAETQRNAICYGIFSRSTSTTLTSSASAEISSSRLSFENSLCAFALSSFGCGVFCRTNGVSLSALESSLNLTEWVREFSRASQSSLSDSSRLSAGEEKFVSGLVKRMTIARIDIRSHILDWIQKLIYFIFMLLVSNSLRTGDTSLGAFVQFVSLRNVFSWRMTFPSATTTIRDWKSPSRPKY